MQIEYITPSNGQNFHINLHNESSIENISNFIAEKYSGITGVEYKSKRDPHNICYVYWDIKEEDGDTQIRIQNSLGEEDKDDSKGRYFLVERIGASENEFGKLHKELEALVSVKD